MKTMHEANRFGASPVFKTYAHGKLLLTGEYVILDGALGLAIPVRFGQSLTASVPENTPQSLPLLYWYSLDEQGLPWFSAIFSTDTFDVVHAPDAAVAAQLQKILSACRHQNEQFLRFPFSIQVVTQNDFPRSWGLGTSSTLIAALARWANADAWQVLAATLGGSGYDLACAYAEGPLLYQLQAGAPLVQTVSFAPPFSENLWCVYLGNKQDSRAGIAHYRQRTASDQALLTAISRLSEAVTTCTDLTSFQDYLLEHERLIGDALGWMPVQQKMFSDYPGAVKSLGAWGGDFVLAAGTLSAEETRRYFSSKGFTVIFPYANMAL